jgi:hypothetical protein
MGFQLPTDTQHLRLETRQYELFNRPLGQGIVRRRLYVGVVMCTLWCGLLLFIGLTPLSRLGPLLFIVPPFAAVYTGTRTGDDGRMAAMRWYDALLARTPRRRRRIRNPLLTSAGKQRAPLRIERHMTELHPHTDLGGPQTSLVRRRARKTNQRGNTSGGAHDEASRADTPNI